MVTAIEVSHTGNPEAIPVSRRCYPRPMSDIAPEEIERFRQALHAATDGTLPYGDSETAQIAFQVAKEHGFSKEVAVAAFESRAAAISAAWPSA